MNIPKKVLEQANNIVTKPKKPLPSREYIIKFVSEWYNEFKDIDKSFRDDKEIVMIAVEKSGDRLKFVSDRLKDDDDVVIASRCLEYASDRLKNDKKVVLSVVKKSGYQLYYVDEKLRDDKEIVFAAAINNAESFQYASKRLKDDYEFVLSIVGIAGHGYVLYHASNRLKDDKKLVMIALNNLIIGDEDTDRNRNMFSEISKRLRTDREVIISAITHYLSVFGDIDENFQNDKELVLLMVKHDDCLFGRLNKKFRSDRDVILAAIKNYDVLIYVNDEIRNDKKIIMEFVSHNGDNLKYASKELQNDKEIVTVAVKQNGEVLCYASEKLQDDIDVVMAAMQSDTSSIRFASDRIYNELKNKYPKKSTEETRIMPLVGHIGDNGSLDIDIDNNSIIIDGKVNPEICGSCGKNVRINGILVPETIREKVKNVIEIDVDSLEPVFKDGIEKLDLSKSRIIPRKLPLTIKELILGCKYIKKGFLPQGLKKITFDSYFDSPLDELLPDGLEELILGTYFEQPLKKLPSKLKVLDLGTYFDNELILPDSLEVFKTSSYLRLPDDFKYPKNLRILNGKSVKVQEALKVQEAPKEPEKVEKNIYGDINNTHCGTIEGNLYGNITGTLMGSIKGDMRGNITGILMGSIKGDMRGNIIGYMGGTIEGNMYGNVEGILMGDIKGKMYGKIIGKGYIGGNYSFQ